MNCYETLFIVKPTLTEEEINAQIEKVKAILTKEGAELVATDDMGMRKLAYPVQKSTRGYYTVLFFKADGAFISELERNLKINEEVIKFLTVKYSKTKEMIQFNKLVAAANKNSASEEPAQEAAPEVAVEAAPEAVETAEETTVETTESAEA